MQDKEAPDFAVESGVRHRHICGGCGSLGEPLCLGGDGVSVRLQCGLSSRYVEIGPVLHKVPCPN